MNLAVVDWTRRDEAQRKQRTTGDEQLFTTNIATALSAIVAEPSSKGEHGHMRM